MCVCFIAFNLSVGAPASGQSCTAASLLPHHPAARAPRAQAWCARGSPRLLGGHDAAVWFEDLVGGIPSIVVNILLIMANIWLLYVIICLMMANNNLVSG